MNCKFAGYKGVGASPKRKSPARQVRRVRDFAGSVATLPMIAVFSSCPSVPRGSSHTCRRYRPKAPSRHRSYRFSWSAGPLPDHEKYATRALLSPLTAASGFWSTAVREPPQATSPSETRQTSNSEINLIFIRTSPFEKTLFCSNTDGVKSPVPFFDLIIAKSRPLVKSRYVDEFIPLGYKCLFVTAHVFCGVQKASDRGRRGRRMKQTVRNVMIPIDGNDF